MSAAVSSAREQHPRPLLLLDIDGALCPFGHEPAGEERLVDGRPLLCVPGLPGTLRALQARFELCWCTAWEHEANLLGAALGLPALAHVAFTAPLRPGATWKLPDVRRAVGEHRPLAWVDDELLADAHTWAAARPGETLLVTTRESTGLSTAQVADLHAFADRCAARA